MQNKFKLIPFTDIVFFKSEVLLILNNFIILNSHHPVNILIISLAHAFVLGFFVFFLKYTVPSVPQIILFCFQLDYFFLTFLFTFPFFYLSGAAARAICLVEFGHAFAVSEKKLVPVTQRKSSKF